MALLIIYSTSGELAQTVSLVGHVSDGQICPRRQGVPNRYDSSTSYRRV